MLTNTIMHSPALAIASLISFLCLLACLGGCAVGKTVQEQCLTCHRGIEHASPSHQGCVSCHGGNPQATAKILAHQGMYGTANPSDIGRWELGCAPCHRYQFARMKSSLMFTNAGMIAQIQATWEGERPGMYAAVAGQQYAESGTPVKHRSVAELDHLSGELYRKFCARCHVARQNDAEDGAGHPAGCAACHFPYGEDATYRGGDPAMVGKTPYGATHALQKLPPLNACGQCHHRSGRIALSYQGLYDGNNGLVPTRNGHPGPVKGSDGRTYTSIAPDIHFSAGMECIDCHTSREIMGDGYAATSIHGQLEVTCEDCHGSPAKPPAYRAIVRENEEPVRESRSYRLPMRPGMEMILTAKDRPFSNVFHADGNVMVQSKRTGQILRAKVITGTPEHTVAGHGRLTCTACHSRTVVQCYGCHTAYDKSSSQMDFIKGQETAGQFTETEDYRMLYPFPLALNHLGRISPVTPGCQTFITVTEADGTTSKSEYVARYKGKRQLRFAPFYSHNTGKKAVGCGECHGNPAFLGFGQHVVEGSSISGTLICAQSADKPLDGFLTLKQGKVNAYSAITRQKARPLNGREVKKTMAVNLCLVCHGSAKDPIYRKELNHRALDDALHRRLLTDR